MSVSTTNTSVTYTAGGTLTGPYSVTFDYDTKSTDVKLLVDGVASTDFTIDGSDDLYTGTVITAGASLKIYRETGKTQDQTFPPNTTPAPEDVAEGLDKLTLITQELETGIGDILELPDGGTDGQFLAKASDTDGDAEWVVAPTGGGSGGVPAAGTTGQVLAKASETDYDTEWVTGGGASNAVLYTAQSLDSSQQSIARGNIGLAYVQPIFADDPSLDGNATATTAAIQTAIDTRRAVMIPAGTYKLNGTLNLQTQGQVIQGESSTRTILTWITDVVGFQIGESTESTATNLPNSSALSNSWGRISSMALYGPAGSSKQGIRNTESATPTLWIGEGWRLDFLHFEGWDTGLFSTKAARYNCRSLVFKACLARGIYLGNSDVQPSATNNCHVFNGVNCVGASAVSKMPIGMELDNVYGGVFTLQDFAHCDIGIKATGCHCDFISGELESYSKRFFELDSSLITIKGARFLGGIEIAPISLNNDCSLLITNSRQAQTGNLSHRWCCVWIQLPECLELPLRMW